MPISDCRFGHNPDAGQSAIGNCQSEILFISLIDYNTFVMFVGERFTGDSIFTFNPPAEIHELAALRTEGTKRIIFPLDWLTAGWTFHESLKPRNDPQCIKERRVA